MARKNSALAAKRLKVRAQTVEYARTVTAQTDYQALYYQHADMSAILAAYTGKVTVCKTGHYTTSFPKRGNAMLGDATAGRAYLATGRRHVYSK
jgi:hypothetical protein